MLKKQTQRTKLEKKQKLKGKKNLEEETNKILFDNDI